MLACLLMEGARQPELKQENGNQPWVFQGTGYTGDGGAEERNRRGDDPGVSNSPTT